MAKLPSSDVVQYALDDSSTVTIRPSGTEPKMKFYIEAVSPDQKGLEGKTASLWKSLKSQLKLPD